MHKVKSAFSLMMMKLWDNFTNHIIGSFCLRALLLWSILLTFQVDAQGPIYDVRLNLSPTSSLKNHLDALHHARLESWKALLRRITPIEYQKRLNDIPETVISNIIDSFSIDDERNTSKGYQGSYLFHYNEKAVKNLLKAYDTPLIETSYPHTLVIPVLKTTNGFALWDEENTLLPAWKDMLSSLEYFNFKIPLGDITDYEIFAPQDLLDGNKEALKKIMDRYNAQDIAIFIIEQTEEKIIISSWPYMMAHNFEPIHFTRNNTLEEQASLGATCFSHLIERWKTLEKTSDSNESYTTQITLPISGLDDLKEKKKILKNINKLQNIRVKRLKANRVTFSVSYDGSRQDLEKKLHNMGIRPILPTSGAPRYVA